MSDITPLNSMAAPYNRALDWPGCDVQDTTFVRCYAETVNCSKIRLNKFWRNQDIVCNFCSEIHGTGSRSEVAVKFLVG